MTQNEPLGAIVVGFVGVVGMWATVKMAEITFAFLLEAAKAVFQEDKRPK